MDKNFGIGFFAFDRLFGTLSLQQPPFNHRGYAVAREKFDDMGTPEPTFQTVKSHIGKK
jgi:sterol desaturase/sphingolipid hydroxylase (fatty acid hydroxylase superfamily)